MIERDHPLARFGHWVAAKGWVHVLLLTGVTVCLYPILWMFLTSIKTDEELGNGRSVPAIPVFHAESPYVRADAQVARPDDVPPSAFSEAMPRLRELTSDAVGRSLPRDVTGTLGLDQWSASATSVLLDRIVNRIPKQTWSSGTDAVVEEYRQQLTPEAIQSAISDQLARLEVSALTLRTVDGRLFKLLAGADFARAKGWHVASHTASLVPLSESTRVDYRFRSGSDEPIVFTYDFELPSGVEPSDIHKLVLSLRADDTWHRLDARLDVGQSHWVSARTTYLAQNRGQSIAFQPPTFDDTTNRARTWVSLRREGPSDRVRNARFTVVLSPSSTLRAVAGKVLRNYVRAFDSGPFARYIANSLVLVALTIAGAVFSSAFVAYAFARLHWPGRGVALVLLLSTMMLPSQVTMIPSFLIWRGLGWYNTLNPIWVPAWFGSAFFIFLMIQHMKTIPRELEEAARIDGFNVLQTWWYIIVPQLKPTLAAIAIMSFLGAWNEFMAPLIYLRDQSKFPLSLGLFGMHIDQGADWSLIMAGNMLMTIPSIVVFFAFQRYFIEGMTVSGMKG